jgi:hypothetical protein
MDNTTGTGLRSFISQSDPILDFFQTSTLRLTPVTSKIFDFVHSLHLNCTVQIKEKHFEKIFEKNIGRSVANEVIDLVSFSRFCGIKELYWVPKISSL